MACLNSLTASNYLAEFCGQVQRQLYAVNRAIEKALLKSDRRVQAAQEVLDDNRRRATGVRFTAQRTAKEALPTKGRN
jgi:hypothetical protein